MIESVLHQTYDNWELLVIDDCSTDRSCERVQSYLTDTRIKLVALDANSGAAVARNKGIELAKGRFIAFLDSDDLWLPKKLEKQVDFHSRSGEAISHTQYEWMNAEGVALGKIISAPALITYDDLLDYNYIGCLTAMYDTGLVGKVFMPDIEKRQDYGLWLDILKAGHRAILLDETLALYRTGQQSLSSNKLKSATYNFKLLRRYQGLSLHKTIWHFCRYVYIALKKYR
ncbi:MAG: glycosyltransferase family 2 protein [Salibacteraceae bacterium]